MQNNSSNALVALRIGTGNTGPAAFAFVGAGLCAARPRPAGCLFGPTGYEGPGVSFTDINVNRTAAIVRFAGGIAPGASAYFTLAGGNLTADSCPGACAGAASYGQPGTSTNRSGHVGIVNTATGNEYLSYTDLRVRDVGLAFVFTRSYNSLDPYIGPFGRGWIHTYGMQLSESSNGSVTIKYPDGFEATFTPLGGGQYIAATPGVFDILVKTTIFTLTRPNQIQFRFSLPGMLLSIADRNGNTQTLAYDAAGRLVSVTAASGRTFTFTYGANARITTLTDVLGGRTVRYSYDANANLVSVQNALGAVTSYTYDASGRIIAVTDPRGNAPFTAPKDAFGRVVSLRDAAGSVTSFAYDTPSPGITTITDPRGGVTRHYYSNLQLVRLVDALGSTTLFGYDPNNNLTSQTDANGHTTLFTYDSRGNRTSITDPLGNKTLLTYDAQNNLLTSTNPLGRTTTFTYDLRETDGDPRSPRRYHGIRL